MMTCCKLIKVLYTVIKKLYKQQCFDNYNKLTIAYLTNEILRNANEIHFIPCEIIVTSTCRNVIYNCYEFYTAVDCCL